MMAPATLGHLRRHRIGLFAWCGRCGWRAILDTDCMAAVRGMNYPIPWMVDDLICRRCGNQRLELQPDWPSQGVVARH